MDASISAAGVVADAAFGARSVVAADVPYGPPAMVLHRWCVKIRTVADAVDV